MWFFKNSLNILFVLLLLFVSEMKFMDKLRNNIKLRSGKGRGSKWWGLAKASEPNNLLPLSPGALFLDATVHTNLKKKQRRLAREHPGVLNAIAKAAKLAISECQYQFRNTRWNCSANSGVNKGKNIFGKIVDRGCPETAFIYAITSAAVTHTIARACSEGSIETCTCDFSHQSRNRIAVLNEKRNRKKHPYISSKSMVTNDWKIRGCSDNIAFGVRFGREFVDAGERGKSIREKMNLHNNEAGRLHVQKEMKQECKCHGVSGSCTVKTCWMRIPTFRSVGNNLKKKFEEAARVFSSKTDSAQVANNVINLHRKRKKSIQSRNSIQYYSNNINDPQIMSDYSNEIENVYSLPKHKRPKFKFESFNPNNKPPDVKDLVYYETSPAFCEKDTKLSILGTQGRQCNITSNSANSCQFMCCGRGFKSHEITVLERCECIFHWCCEVKCKTCKTKKIIHTCL